jgi:hypothetical protein
MITKPTVTRTQNPLPFEHLEPKRFEDLARQLAYGFRTWRQLEATGRAGSDDGFDARGFEIIPTGQNDPTTDEEDEDELIAVGSTDRLWLVQCKRERAIRPAQMKKHLAAIPAESREGLYGILFVAACDFSLATRDVLRTWSRENGLTECVIWGKGELEDLLFQPKNDGLLFAYFGISLQIRRQKQVTDIRRTIALKRKLKRLGEKSSDSDCPVLLRDISDGRYPYVDEGKTLKSSNSLWLPYSTLGLGIFGLKLLIKEFWAFYDWETECWDIASSINFSIPPEHCNPWYDFQCEENRDDQIFAITAFWRTFPERHRFFMRIVTCLPYSEILEIDDVGDSILNIPTVFCIFSKGRRAVFTDTRIYFRSHDTYPQEYSFDADKHTLVFPDEMRNPEWEADFFGQLGIKRASEHFPVELADSGPMEIPE